MPSPSTGDAAGGVLAAAATPLLGAIGLFAWSRAWTGTAFALNLVKCSVGTLGFALMGMLTTVDAGWLAGATPTAVTWLVMSSLLGIVVGDNLWLHALRVIGARRVILVGILQPFVALILARAVLREPVSAATIAGMAVTLIGVLTVSLEKDDATGGGDDGDDGDGGDGEGGPAEVELPEMGGASAAAAVAEDATASTATAFSAAAAARSRGYAAAALNVVFDTLGTVLTKRHGASMNTWEINFIRFGFAAVSLACVAGVRAAVARRGSDASNAAYARVNDDDEEGGGGGGGGGDTLKEVTAPFFLPSLTRDAWALVLLGVGFTTFLAPGLGNYALFRVPSLAVFSTLMCVGPLYSLPLGWYVKGERVTWRAVGGSFVAVVGCMPMIWGL
jgi:drug/metabolite transporter (DMT)-like permease